MKTIAALALMLSSGLAMAQYKCVGADGKTTFQQLPCPASDKEQKVRGDAVKPAASGPSATQVSTPEQRQQAAMERERRQEERSLSIENLERQINYLQDLIVRRNGQMSAELAALQDKKADARSDAAGATGQQALSAERQAVTQKYKTMNDADFERLRQLRSELDGVKAIKP